MDKLLLLVDGSSYLYRAYYALPNLRNTAGEPTGAIFGFLNMLIRLEKDYPTAYLACIFDAKGKTFRNDLYTEYKANRPPMPEDLAKQTAPIRALVKMRGWPVLSVEGIEADDVIGTLVKSAEKEGFQCIVSTGDKDLSQLVTGNTRLVNTMTDEILDTEGVVKKFGVPPEKIIDFLSLTGDKADNIPGVNKVGEKTAAKWLGQYGSLDAIIENASSVKGAVGENLRLALDWLPKARELVTIRTDCSLGEGFTSISASLQKQPEDTEGLKKEYARCGFKSLLKEISQKAPPAGSPPGQSTSAEPPAQAPLFDEPASAGVFIPKKDYETVLTETQLNRWIEQADKAEITAVDTETTSLDALQAKIVGISLSVEPGIAAYIPVAHSAIGAPDQLPAAFVLEKLRPWLENPDKKKVGQNLKYDAHVFANHGITLKGIAHDTLLQSYVLESHRRHDMDSLSERLLGHTTIKYEDVCGKGKSKITFDQADLNRASEYAAEDADVTLQLFHHMQPLIEKDEKYRFIYEKIELPCLSVLHQMERTGILIDSAKLLAQSAELGKEMGFLEQKAHEAAGEAFNLNSPKQLGEILFDKLKIPPVKKTPSGTPSTSEEVLEKLALDYPLPKILLNYRGLAKLKSTYTDKLPKMVNPKTGRVHTNFAQAVAVTGRLASSDPNLQNIPVRTEEGRKIRNAFIAPEGSFIVSADYSQIELRIMAHLSGDPGLLKAFHEGQDVHRATAAEVFGTAPENITPEQRRYAKVINFGLIYGMSAFGLAESLEISRRDARDYIDRYFQRYPGVAEYMDKIRRQARARGYVETVFGRRLWLPEIASPNGPRRQGAERAAINAPMQGTAADIIKLSMIAVQKWLEESRLASRLVLQVHDELVLEVPENELETVKARLPELMEAAASLDVPLIADVGCGKNWGEAH